MTRPTNPDHNKAAIQYLVWALEEIDKAGHPKAAHHARIALEELRGALQSADKPDKHAPL